MRSVFFFLPLIIVMHSNAQNNPYILKIKNRWSEGYIFPNTYTEFPPLENVYDRFTPSKEDVLKAEQVLKEQIKMLNSGLLNQYGDCPVIHKTLRKFKRQYVGIIDDAGNKIIWINFVWDRDKDLIKLLDKEVIIILDGCSYHWSVKVNLEEEKLFDLSVNGIA